MLCTMCFVFGTASIRFRAADLGDLLPKWVPLHRKIVGIHQFCTCRLTVRNGIALSLSFAYDGDYSGSSVSKKCAVPNQNICGGGLRTIATFFVLMALWLLMSGIYTAFMIGMGVGSVFLVLFVVSRMNTVDGDRPELGFSLARFAKYMAWLMAEIARSNWAVTKIILSPNMQTRQHLFTVPAIQKSDMAQVMFANSITLTPGTITVETEPGRFLVHALLFDDAARQGVTDMGQRVSDTEIGGAK